MFIEVYEFIYLRTMPIPNLGTKISHHNYVLIMFKAFENSWP